MLHKAAKKAFDELGVKKLPTVKSLSAEYAQLVRIAPRARRCERLWCISKTSPSFLEKTGTKGSQKEDNRSVYLSINSPA